MVLIIHVLGFFGVLIPLWVLAPRSSASSVFTGITNFGGWPTNGLAFMVGLLTPVYTLLGADSAVHMAEEIKDASLVLPRAIMTSAAVNGTLGFIMTITFCFTLGNPATIIASPTGYPFIQVFFDATNSYAGASIMTAVIIVNITSACISTVATVSRQTWSFARDNGLPFSGFIAHVSFSDLLPENRAWRTDFPHLGQAWLEHPAQCSSSYVYHHVPPFADQHWLDRCLQRDRVLGSCRHPRNVHNLDQHLHSASTQGPASAPPVELRHHGDLHQHWCGGLARDGVGVLLFPRFHPRHRRDHELECGHVRWHLSYWIGLLVRLGQDGVQAACLPRCARLVRIPLPPKKQDCSKLEAKWVSRSSFDLPVQARQRSE
jgi:hypothetical protein